MNTEELLELPASAQAGLIARREISCVELTRTYLCRIERYNPRLRAFVEVFKKEALVTAGLKDAAVRARRSLPAFHGVPTAIKDLNLVRGRRSRFGSRAVLPFWSPIDDASVLPLRQAGFVILGKLATSELGALPITEPDIHPPTRNPWDPNHSAGGSSGGSGSAVAARLLPVAHGSDGGGSIRIPASFNGLVGLKPARGRLKNQFWLPDRQILYTTGALTRTVTEAAELLDVMAGITAGRPHWATPPEEPFARLAGKKPRSLRIRLTYDTPLAPADPEVRAAIEKTAKLLASLGHVIEEAPYPQATVEEFVPIWGLAMSRMPGMRWRLAQPVTRWLREHGMRADAGRVLAAQGEIERRLLGWFEGTDLWLTPTSVWLPPEVGAFKALQQVDPEAAFFKIATIGAFTAICNVTGQPAISLPAGFSKSGLPIGAHLVGPPEGEALLLQVSRQLEEAGLRFPGAPEGFL